MLPLSGMSTFVQPIAEARWFTRDEVAKVLSHPQGTNIHPAYKEVDNPSEDQQQRRSVPMGQRELPAFRLPSRTAVSCCISHTEPLLTWFADRRGVDIGLGSRRVW